MCHESQSSPVVSTKAFKQTRLNYERPVSFKRKAELDKLYVWWIIDDFQVRFLACGLGEFWFKYASE